MIDRIQEISPTLGRNARKDRFRVSDIALITAVFLLFFGPRVFGSFLFDLISITSVAVFLLALAKSGVRTVLAHLPMALVLLFGLSALYSLVVIAITGNVNFFFTLRSLRCVVNLLGVVGIVVLYRERYQQGWGRFLVSHVFLSIGLHSSIMVGQFFVPEFNAAVADLAGMEHFKLGRVAGLTNSYNTLNIVTVFAVLIGMAYYAEIRTVLPAYSIFGFLLVQLFSLLLAGRFAAILGILLVLLLLLLVIVRRGFIRAFGGLTLVSLLVLSVAVGIEPEFKDRLFDSTLVHYIEAVSDVLFHGDLTQSYIGRTADVVINEMWFLPETPHQLWFGNGFEGRDQINYVASDVGYVLIIFGNGILGLALILLVFFLLAISGAKAARRGDRAGILLLALVFLCLAVSVKEQALLTRHAFTGLTLMYLLVVHRATATGRQERQDLARRPIRTSGDPGVESFRPLGAQ